MQKQKGFSLIVILVGMAVMLILLAMAATSAVQMMHYTHVQAARRQLEQVRDVSVTLAICQAEQQPPQACNSLPYLLPAPGTIQLQEYVFMYSGPGAATWTYTAQPLIASLPSFYVDQTGVLRCLPNLAYAGQYAGPSSQVCP